jgi:4-oxalocrotonate tautomerase
MPTRLASKSYYEKELRAQEKIMPHVIVKPWPGKSEKQKQQLADAIAQDVMNVLSYGEESVSVAIEEIRAEDWAKKVSEPNIVGRPESLYKKPGYTM